MKKRFLVLATVLLAAVLLVSTTTTAFAETDTDYKNSEAYAFLTEFLTVCPERAGTLLEKYAADYLKLKFDGLCTGVSGYTSEILAYKIDNSDYVFNVVAKIPAATPTEKQVIIGAHFDSVYEGANDNASGVTALYLIMKNIAARQSQLAVNVVFVAFGGEERSLFGSDCFAEQMTASQRDNTLVMINMDSIANGDNLYVMCENKKTDLAKFVLSHKTPVKISEKPHAIGVYPVDNSGYGYYELVQNSDHTSFRLRNIPTLLYFSGTFDGANWGFSESKDKSKNTMNTKDDNFVNLDGNNGAKFVERIESVVISVTDTLLDADFVKVASGARKQMVNNKLWYNVWWPRLVVLGLCLVIVLFVVLYYRKLQKKAILGTAEIKNDTIFTTPDSDNIFTFSNNPSEQAADPFDQSDDGSSDIDDIFAFKK